jgi:arylformamidase
MASHFEPAGKQDEKRIFGWKRVIDITLPLHDGMAKPSPAFEGFRLYWDLRIEKGQGRNRSRFSMESHLGTHVDAPVHFIQDGKFIDQVPGNLFGMRRDPGSFSRRSQPLSGKSSLSEILFKLAMSD